jgi:uncharacterized protein (DUF1800 family)
MRCLRRPSPLRDAPGPRNPSLQSFARPAPRLRLISGDVPTSEEDEARLPAPSLDAAAAHRVLGRAGYGARPRQAEVLTRPGGLARWVEAQLAMPPGDDPTLARRLAEIALPIRAPAGPGEQITEENRPLASLAASQADRWALLPVPGRYVAGVERARPLLELSIATVLRKAEAEAQLRERMVEFWHDHFSVSARSGLPVQVSLAEHDARIRAHALGSFRALLEVVATSPAMLFYLDNQSSRAGAPNENFARELLELHTLGREAYAGAAPVGREVPRGPDGVASAYVDGDVWEAARAFTGWSIANGQRLDPTRALPRSGAFVFVDAWSDPYQKRFLGRDLDPFPPAMAHGRAVLDTIAAHKATARHTGTKLARFLIGDGAETAAASRRAAEAFHRHAGAPDQIARVLRALLLEGPEIAAPGAGRVRRPLDLVAAAAHAYAIPLSPNPALVGQLALGGQQIFGWPAPDGQPVSPEPYLGASALRWRWQCCQALTRDAWRTGTTPLFAELAGRPAAEAAEALARRALGPGPAARPVAETIAATWEAGGRNPAPNRAEVAEIAGWVLAAPAFQSS